MSTADQGKSCKPMVEFHADDYGLFPAQSRRILDCREHGCLNGVSIISNSPALSGTMEALAPFRENLAVAVHLNLVEGRSISPAEEIDLLTDEDSVFRCSFGGLLLAGLGPKRDRYKEQLKRELRAQLQAAAPYLGTAPLRLDSHCHWHMLPVVFDSLMEVIAEDGYPVAYIRIPRERVSLYLRHWGELEGFRPINLIKVLILNLPARRDIRRHREYMTGLEQRIFLGVMFSGHMSAENVRAVLPDAVALAGRMGQGVEVLAHPGGVEEPEDISRLTSRDDVVFLTSRDRKREAAMFREAPGIPY